MILEDHKSVAQLSGAADKVLATISVLARIERVF
jgi:hypothetical protein